MNKRIAVITDTAFISSGYFNIGMPLCNGLAKLGYDIKVAGLGYKGEEHFWDFSIIPAENLKEVATITKNLENVWPFDIMLVALDIPIQAILLKGFETRDFKYIGIFPIEADELSFKWAMTLMLMDKSFCISEFGTKEAEKKFVPVEHLAVGLDTNAWRLPLEGEKETIRIAYGLPKDAFVVLTVADNQERKNWDSMLRAFAKFAEVHPNSYYVVVSRLKFFAGWDLDELAIRYGIRDKMVLLERGMAFRDLWGVYAMSDAFLLLSKAEGLGMIVLEAMAVGLPVVATGCTAQLEHLSDNRGFLIDYLVDEDYGFPPIDPFGLGYRYWANITQASNKLIGLAQGKYKHDKDGALEYVRSREWGNAVDQVDKAIEAFDE